MLEQTYVDCKNCKNCKTCKNCKLKENCKYGNVSEMARLINEGADVNHEFEPYNETPAYVASEEGHHECLEMLIKPRIDGGKGADVNKARKNGRTPTYIACSNGHTECLTLLIESGADAQKPQKIKPREEKTMMVHIKRRRRSGMATALGECLIPTSDPTSMWLNEIAAKLTKGPLEMSNFPKPHSVKDELKVLLLTDELIEEAVEEAEAEAASAAEDKRAAAQDKCAKLAELAKLVQERNEELAKRARERFEIRGVAPLDVARERGHAAAAAIVHIATLDETDLTTDELSALIEPGLLEVALSAAFAKSPLRTLERIADLVKGFRAEADRVKRFDVPSSELSMTLVLKAQQAAVGLLRALDDVGVDVKRLLGEDRGASARMALVLAECKVTLADVMLQHATAAQWSLVNPEGLMDAAIIALRSVWHVAVIAVYPPFEKMLAHERTEKQKNARENVYDKVDKENQEDKVKKPSLTLASEEPADQERYVRFKVDGKVVSSYWRKENGSSDKPGKREIAARATFSSRRAKLAENKAESVLREYPILQPAFKFYSWTSLQLLLAVLLTALPAERGKHITALLLAWTVQLVVLEAHEAYDNRRLWAADPLNMCVHARASLSANPRCVPWY